MRRLPYRLIAFVLVVIVCGLPLLIWYQPMGAKIAFDDGPLGQKCDTKGHVLHTEQRCGNVCANYNYIFPDVKQYHILLGQLDTYKRLEAFSKGDVGCRRPITAKLYL